MGYSASSKSGYNFTCNLLKPIDAHCHPEHGVLFLDTLIESGLPTRGRQQIEVRREKPRLCVGFPLRRGAQGDKVSTAEPCPLQGWS